ncbi:MAG: hypothetical protein LBU06_00280 [Desulfovibrio sp.]|jgi:hypothetical protein|nr:hypothetical protein [Desulfovibrio sp.]
MQTRLHAERHETLRRRGTSFRAAGAFLFGIRVEFWPKGHAGVPGKSGCMTEKGVLFGILVELWPKGHAGVPGKSGCMAEKGVYRKDAFNDKCSKMSKCSKMFRA